MHVVYSQQVLSHFSGISLSPTEIQIINTADRMYLMILFSFQIINSTDT